jgi:hypothetical protein
VQEQGRKHEHRNGVAPIKHPIETIQTSAERKREKTEERDRQPKEMKRGWIARTQCTHGTADKQRKDADTGEQEIERTCAVRNGRNPQIYDFAGAQSQHGIARRGSWPRAVERSDNVAEALHRLVVDRQEHIATTKIRLRGRGVFGDLGRNDALGADPPQHTVLDLVERGPCHDVRGA